MASRVKDDEKNERIIRGLLKLQENRRCVNCNSMGPQYVCTNFWTFVCTTCSGIHREFTHRVKSVSMAKFTSQEVGALQGGGNQRAREIYLKEWDAHHHSIPDSSNVERLRDFIKHVYVDKRYTSERSLDKPPRGDKEELYESRKADTSQIGSRSPYEDASDRRYSGRNSPGGRSDDKNSRDIYDGRRSPGYELETRQYGDQKRSPAHSEIVNDWRRDDRFGNERRYEDQKNSGGDSRLEGRSPEREKESIVSSPPIVCPVRDILGDNVTPLRIIEPPKANTGRTNSGFAQTPRTASSSSFGLTNGNLVEPKSESLIDFDTDPDPPVSAAATQAQKTTLVQTVSTPLASSSNENWASFDFSPEMKLSQAPAAVNTLESVLSQLSVPASVPRHSSGISPSGGSLTTAGTNNMPNLSGSVALPTTALGYTTITTFSGGAPAAASTSANIFSTYSPSGAPAATPVSAMPISVNNTFVRATDAGQWPNMQHQQHTLFPATSYLPAAQQITPSVGGALSNQPWNSSLASTTQGLLTNPGVQASQAVAQDANSVASQSLTVQANMGGRRALPEDLFAANYSSIPVPTPGWQTGPLHGMGFAMHYNTAAAIPTFPQPPRSTNPFDVSAEPFQPQASAFSSMAPLQRALPNMPTPTLTSLPIPSLGSPPTAWMPLQSSPYTTVLPPHAPSYTSAVPPRAYIGHQVHSDMSAARHQGVGNYIREGPSFGPLNPNPELVGRYSTSATPNPLSSVGSNPFA